MKPLGLALLLGCWCGLALLARPLQPAAASASGNSAQAKSAQAEPARVPLVFWEHGLETAETLKQAGLAQFAVPPEQVKDWRKAGFAPIGLSLKQLQTREKLLTPRLAGRAQVASATSRPWIDANGWRFQRQPQGKFYYELPANKAVLAAAEAFTYNADVVLRVTAETPLTEIAAFAKFLAFTQQLPASKLPAVADINVIEDRSPDLGEVLNLLSRRNLLYQVSAAAAPVARLNLKLGTPEFPLEAAANPSDFALRVRRQLTDEQRSLRLYGTELVLCRLLSDGQHARVFLLNYGGREMESLRLRVRGRFAQGSIAAFGVQQTGLEEFVAEPDATEFTLGAIGVYAVVDLSR